jgi:hypothetical protein
MRGGAARSAISNSSRLFTTAARRYFKYRQKCRMIAITAVCLSQKPSLANILASTREGEGTRFCFDQHEPPPHPSKRPITRAV